MPILNETLHVAQLKRGQNYVLRKSLVYMSDSDNIHATLKQGTILHCISGGTRSATEAFNTPYPRFHLVHPVGLSESKIQSLRGRTFTWNWNLCFMNYLDEPKIENPLLKFAKAHTR